MLNIRKYYMPKYIIVIRPNRIPIFKNVVTLIQKSEVPRWKVWNEKKIIGQKSCKYYICVYRWRTQTLNNHRKHFYRFALAKFQSARPKNISTEAAVSACSFDRLCVILRTTRKLAVWSAVLRNNFLLTKKKT